MVSVKLFDLLLIVYLICGPIRVQSQNFESSKGYKTSEWIKSLMSDYNNNIPPATEDDKQVDVSVYITFDGFDYLDDQKQRLQSNFRCTFGYKVSVKS